MPFKYIKLFSKILELNIIHPFCVLLPSPYISLFMRVTYLLLLLKCWDDETTNKKKLKEKSFKDENKKNYIKK